MCTYGHLYNVTYCTVQYMCNSFLQPNGCINPENIVAPVTSAELLTSHHQRRLNAHSVKNKL